ncbi:uncharacterized protein MONBRDRAFT_33187 [Monosiga brevicollis MX1]|uniref:Tubulin delta chain n=1 Tax=Monosiga brevicollis TaxID=81824 RepID=A9V3K7_MONBE|nr:uncharacterized protein MONBRDRAFT_33187 [Monosiga brevicollis MX1]EDQ87929.1 predicted protein [Monosiga brevicollis MX1]|eukprot:XP_001747462.1 hypothetical protein [Monosiga brevicollis MX1]
MATISLQIGQAGNQVGYAVLERLAHEFDCPDSHFRPVQNARASAIRSGQHRARAVVMDSEPKVVRMLNESTLRLPWCYSKRQTMCEQRGAGNNWANGYMRYGHEYHEFSLDAIRREAEAADRVDAFQVYSSVAGGTGSGLGARVTELVREAYPKSALTNMIVLPYMTGEVIVQFYNAVLSLSHLTTASDAIFLLRNDDAHRVAQSSYKLKTVTMDALNNVYANDLAHALGPSRAAAGADCGLLDPSLLSQAQRVAHLVPHPDYKLLTTHSIPQMPESYQAFSRYDWSSLTTTARAMALADSPVEEGFNRRLKPAPGPVPGDLNQQVAPARGATSLATLVTLRGDQLGTANCSAFWEEGLYSAWAPSPVLVAGSTLAFGGHAKSVSTVLNGSRNAMFLDAALERTQRMFSKRAYVHQYEAFGLQATDIENAMLICEQVVASYAGL